MKEHPMPLLTAKQILAAKGIEYTTEQPLWYGIMQEDRAIAKAQRDADYAWHQERVRALLEVVE